MQWHRPHPDLQEGDVVAGSRLTSASDQCLYSLIGQVLAPAIQGGQTIGIGHQPCDRLTRLLQGSDIDVERAADEPTTAGPALGSLKHTT
jgi:hypothetical protein